MLILGFGTSGGTTYLYIQLQMLSALLLVSRLQIYVYSAGNLWWTEYDNIVTIIGRLTIIRRFIEQVKIALVLLVNRTEIRAM